MIFETGLEERQHDEIVALKEQIVRMRITCNQRHGDLLHQLRKAKIELQARIQDDLFKDKLR